MKTIENKISKISRISMKNRTSLKDKIKRSSLSLMLGASLLGLGGCASVNWAVRGKGAIITNTPDIKENGKFSNDGRYIVYSIVEKEKKLYRLEDGYFVGGDHFYCQPSNEDDNNKAEIDVVQFRSMLEKK